jgi:hypothetical protein
MYFYRFGSDQAMFAMFLVVDYEIFGVPQAGKSRRRGRRWGNLSNWNIRLISFVSPWCHKVTTVDADA